MADMKQADLEKRAELIRGIAVGLSLSIEELYQDEDVNMYDEIIDYLQEKRGCFIEP